MVNYTIEPNSTSMASGYQMSTVEWIIIYAVIAVVVYYIIYKLYLRNKYKK